MAQWANLRRLFLSSHLSAAGLLIVIVFGVLTLLYMALGARITPYDPNAVNLLQSNLPPTSSHFFGTDLLGRDIFSRVIAALPLDIGLSIIVVLLSVAIGVFLGIVAGHFGGILDEAIMRITDLFLAFPTLVMVLAIAATLGASLLSATLSILFVWWPPYVRLVRGGVLEVSTQDFVAISKTLNSSFSYIMRKGIIPNIVPTLITYATLDVGTALLSLSILGFLGVGIPAGAPELGVMTSSIGINLYTYPWEAVFPAIVVTVIVLGFSFVGEGAREAFDVKVRSHILFRGKGLKSAREIAQA